ncbi:hypothetical protein KGF57_001888 [Candida theae]|uniref:CENP-V/GFA domain-containing protein n=1 Tax=Candida theae TaxID=1198502 RepID=A0AAD5FZD4_9ASCO|nr:uncharacterized protein KGF57_001888 [Candida theae]KAI5960691.1 hypothetical protein KGF57_001888 [Candida theae]
MSYTGSCLCGEVSLKLIGEPSRSFVCYCVDCRKGSGHLGQFISQYATDKVAVFDKNGTVAEYVVEQTKSGHPKRKQFCKRCGCTIRTLPMKFNGEVSMVRQSLVDENFAKLAPQLAMFEEEKSRYTEGAKSEYL